MISQLIFLSTILTLFSLIHGSQAYSLPDITPTGHLIGDTVKELSSDVWIVFQDKDNNYWFGSNGEGVYVYNPSIPLRASGKTLIRFTTKHGLSNNYIREILQDKEGNMYFGTLNGICKFDGHTITQLNPVKPLVPQSGWKLQSDDLWFKGNSIVNGPYRYDGQTLYDLDFPKHDLEDELPAQTGNVTWDNHGVYTIYKDSKGNIWFGSSTFGACRYDGQSLTWISENEITFQTDAYGVRAIIEDEDGWMWLTHTLFRYKIDETKPTGQSSFGYKKEKGIGHGDCDYFQSIVKDDAGDYWMVTFRGGVYRYNPASDKMTHYPVMKGGVQIALFAIYKDNSGGLWLGTQEDGVYRYNGNEFKKFEF